MIWRGGDLMYNSHVFLDAPIGQGFQPLEVSSNLQPVAISPKAPAPSGTVREYVEEVEA